MESLINTCRLNRCKAVRKIEITLCTKYASHVYMSSQL